MPADFRRGADAIASAQKKAKSGGEFTPFTPEHFWKGGDEKFLLFLNPLNDIPTVDVISFIPVIAKKADGTSYERYERVIARTDDALGEDSDPMTEDWDAKPRATCVAVAVELEPTYAEVNGRKRPTGFSVKTREFERRIRDEEGELTEERELVVAPEIGIIHASPHNFFNVVTSYDESEAPIEATALKITRIGDDQNTVYSVSGYIDQEIDLSELIDNIDNVYYLNSEIEDLINLVDSAANDEEAALIIGEAMLDKRLDELVDEDRYDELYKGITKSLDKFGAKKKAAGSSRPAAKRERPARSSQRTRAAKDESAEEAPEPEAVEAAEEPKAKPARRSRAKAEPKDEPAKKSGTGKSMRERMEDRKAQAAS